MNALAACALTAALALAAPARAAQAAAPPAGAYDAKAAPLDDLSKELLAGNGYELRDDGTVWDKINEAAVSGADMPYLLSRLASARRLRALLQLNNIITRYDAERKLTPEDKEAVRRIARENWIVFGVAPRHDFRSYFSPEELETLDKIPSRFESMGVVTMTDPAPESVTAEPPPAAASAPVPAAVAPPAVSPSTAASSAAAAPAALALPAPVPPAAAPAAPAAAEALPAAAGKAVPTLAPMMDMPSLKRPSPFAAAPAAPPAPAAAPAPPPAIATPDLGVLKPWTPPAASTAPAAAAAPAAVSTGPAVAVASAAAVAAPPPPAPEPPKPAIIGAAEYEKFVAEGPYSKEGKALLELAGKRAPEFCLPLLRRTVVGALPTIALDGARTGAGLRAGLLRPADPAAPPVVALSPGPLMVQVKKGLFGGRRDVLLPEDPAAWADLGLARPGLAALRADAPATTENGDWGAVRVYADGSRRGTYSQAQQAGELLEQLLRLGLAREGLDASEYAARRWARAARLMFEARLKDEAKQDGFLDPDRRAELRAWLDRAEESDDALVSAWAGSRVQAFDPRRGPPDAAREFEAAARASCGRTALEDALAAAARRRARRVGILETLLDAGVIDAGAAKGAAQSAADEEAAARTRLLASPPPCPAPDAGRDAALRKSSLLLGEAARAERAWREAKAGQSHDR